MDAFPNYLGDISISITSVKPDLHERINSFITMRFSCLISISALFLLYIKLLNKFRFAERTIPTTFIQPLISCKSSFIGMLNNIMWIIVASAGYPLFYMSLICRKEDTHSEDTIKLEIVILLFYTVVSGRHILKWRE